MMKNILKHVFIKDSVLFIDGNLVLKGENPIFAKFLKEVYKFAKIKYPKYYKMDPLSKLGFLASEVLLQNQELASYPAERIGIAVNNRASTYLVDCKHQESINHQDKYFPSPANFVYTLPNVMTGEICIRNGFKGENAVFISEIFDAAFMCNYLNTMFAANKSDLMISGFVDADENHYEAFLFLAKNDGKFNAVYAKEIEELYNQLKDKTNIEK